MLTQSVGRTGTRLSRAAPVVTRDTDVGPDPHDFMVEAQDVERVELGYLREPEAPFRAPVDGLDAVGNAFEEVGELLSTTSTVFQNKREERDPVRAPSSVS